MPEKAIKLSKDDMQRILVIYESYHAMIKQVAMYVLRDAALAEDCTHEVMLRLMGLIGSVDDKNEKKLCAYIAKMTRNLAVDMYRRGGWETCLDDDDLIAIMQSDWKQSHIDRYFLDENGFSMELCECINQLTAGEQSVIYLKYACDFPFEKVAGILCIEKSCAEQRASRARKKLRKMLEEMDYER